MWGSINIAVFIISFLSFICTSTSFFHIVRKSYRSEKMDSVVEQMQRGIICPKLDPITNPVGVADLCLGCELLNLKDNSPFHMTIAGFWGPEVEFAKVRGVISTVVGYAGGETDYPTYKSIQDHTEAIRLEFDPSVISYEEILMHFFNQQGGPPGYPSYSRQYRSAILYHSEEQKGIAERVIADYKRSGGSKKVFTDVDPATDFYRAEEYHQKFYFKQNRRAY